MNDPSRSWDTGNQRVLSAAIAEVTALLRRQIAMRRADKKAAAAADAEIAAAADRQKAERRPLTNPPALDIIAERFGLSPFESWILTLAAGCELSAELGPLCAEIRGDPRLQQPTFGLALSVASGAHWSALSPHAPLRRFRLVEIGSARGITDVPLQIDERISCISCSASRRSMTGWHATPCLFSRRKICRHHSWRWLRELPRYGKR
jgi:hypothetical protein